MTEKSWLERMFQSRSLWRQREKDLACCAIRISGKQSITMVIDDDVRKEENASNKEGCSMWK